MDPKILASVVNTSSGRCWASEINNPVPGAIDKSPSNDGYEVSPVTGQRVFYRNIRCRKKWAVLHRPLKGYLSLGNGARFFSGEETKSGHSCNALTPVLGQLWPPINIFYFCPLYYGSSTRRFFFRVGIYLIIF